MPTGHLPNWNMLEPRKLSPVSMEPRRAETAVMTPMTENTPIVIPDMVRNDRSLFTPSEPNAILRISFIPERDDRVQARRPQRRDKPGDDAGRDRHHDGDQHQAEGEHERERRHGGLHSRPEQVGDPEPDDPAREADRDSLDEELKQNRPPPRAEVLLGANLLRARPPADKREVHDSEGPDKERQARHKEPRKCDPLLDRIKL